MPVFLAVIHTVVLVCCEITGVSACIRVPTRQGFIREFLPGGELDSMYFSTCIVFFVFLWFCC